MDVSKVFAVLCSFLLIICLCLSITTVSLLYSTAKQKEEWQDGTDAPVEEPMESAQEQSSTTKPTETDKEDAPSVSVDVLYQRLCMREVGGKIGIYSEDGYLIRTLDVQVSTLPKKDREELSKGIYVNSWKELISLIQDYE